MACQARPHCKPQLHAQGTGGRLRPSLDGCCIDLPAPDFGECCKRAPAGCHNHDGCGFARNKIRNERNSESPGANGCYAEASGPSSSVQAGRIAGRFSSYSHKEAGWSTSGVQTGRPQPPRQLLTQRRKLAVSERAKGAMAASAAGQSLRGAEKHSLDLTAVNRRSGLCRRTFAGGRRALRGRPKSSSPPRAGAKTTARPCFAGLSERIGRAS